MKKSWYIPYILFFCLALILSTGARGEASEYIDSFDVTAVLHSDARMDVTEKITFNVTGQEIQRGIIRDIPIPIQRLSQGFLPKFTLVECLLDDRPIPVQQTTHSGTISLRIGDPERRIPLGIHTFTIRYTVQHLLTYFDTFDELPWNVTGNDWAWPIYSASFQLKLPNNATALRYDAYTGYRGEKKKDYLYQDGIFYTTTLTPGQGFTVGIAFPKGLITPEPATWRDKWELLLRHSPLSVTLAACLTILLALATFLRHLKKERDLVIPLFLPPDNMDPAQIYFATNYFYTQESFTGQVLYLAVNKYLKIVKDNRQLSLQKIKNKNGIPLSPNTQALYNTLFTAGDTLDLTDSNRGILINALAAGTIPRKTAKQYRIRNFMGFIFLLPFFLFAYLCAPVFESNIFSIFIFGAAGLIALVQIILNSYTLTEKGRQLCTAIRGFILYLRTAEKDRLEALYPALTNDIPEHTPELFESLLPYAFVLGVTKTWVNSFSKELKRIQYSAKWYVTSTGTPIVFDTTRTFTRLTADLNRNVRSSMSPPSTGSSGSSFSSGGGSSGGGYGGGGGRGW